MSGRLHLGSLGLAAALLAAAAPPSDRPVAPPEPGSELRFASDTAGTIAVSIYSLPSSLVPLGEAGRFLSAVHAARPARTVVVITDHPATALPPGVVAAPPGGRDFSPWPRDPFLLATGRGGSLVAVERPNRQAGREEDAAMAEAVVAALPAALAARGAGAAVAAAPVPFHAGQMLATPDALWLSIHSVEPGALAILGEARVPVATFASAAGVERYLAAVRRAADELGKLTGRPARFVHPWPGGSRAADAMSRLAGGAGFDLDSLVTFLPGEPGRAFVADLGLGRTLLATSSDGELSDLAATYRLRGDSGRLRTALGGHLAGERARGLEAFLDDVAGSLATQGLVVERLPLLLVPTSLLDGGAPWPDFLVGWNNVVVEAPPGAGPRAEGFASGMPAADAAVAARFADAGVPLTLFPPLVESVVRNGGYRCASNHWRPAP